MLLYFDMADIRFENEYTAPSRMKLQKNSRITQFFIDASFGLLKTPGQAMVAQIVVAIFLFACAGYLFSRSGDTAVPTSPDQNLINAPQPARPLN